MPTPTTADLATLVHTAAGDLMSDYADLLEIIWKYDPTYKLKNKIEGPIHKALLKVQVKLLNARMQIQEAISIEFTQLKIPDKKRNDWKE